MLNMAHPPPQWLPTLQSIATGGRWESEPDRVLDGLDQWPALLSDGGVPPPRTNALLSYYHSTARNRGAALRWNTEGHEYKMVFDAQINGAVWTPVPAANAGSARGRALMGGGGAEHGGANCTGNGNQMRCFWLFDLSLDDDERVNIFDDNLGSA
jgi:hypothetical protein